MGHPANPSPVLFLAAAFGRHEEALDWARARAAEAWGPIALESDRFGFDATAYYDRTMGPSLRKVFFAFRNRIDPAALVDRKLTSNAWEAEYAAMRRHPEPRPLNVDPGYLTLGKLVLASTKDFAHRVYLGRGIYAEITLYYRQHGWRHHEWTFADYRRPDYQEFFTRCRDYLHGLVREERAA